MNIEDITIKLEAITKRFDLTSDEEESIELGALALLYIQMKLLKSDFKNFLSEVNNNLTSEQKEFLKRINND